MKKIKMKKQIDHKDCGIVVVQSLSHYFHNVWHDINLLKLKAKYNSEGISGSNLIKLGELFGVKFEGFRANMEELNKTVVKDYFVALLEFDGYGHYVICRKIKNKIEVLDPIKGHKIMNQDEYEKVFRNIIFLATESFLLKYEKQKSITSLVFANPNLLVVICFQILISLLLNFVATTFTKIIMDKIIPGRLNGLLMIVFVVFSTITIMRVMNNFIKNYFSKKIDMQINYEMSAIYYRKISNISVNDLNKLTISDHTRRIFLLNEVSGFISQGVFMFFNQAITFLIAMSILITISTTLFSIALFTTFSIAILSILFQLKIKSDIDIIQEDSLIHMNAILEKINSFKEQKSPAFESYIFNKYATSFIKNTKNQYKMWKVFSLQNVISEIINSITPLFITYISVKQSFDNKMSIGNMLMFLSVLGYFSSPVNEFCSFITSYPETKKNIKMISFIINMESENLNENGLLVGKVKSITLKPMLVSYDKPIFKTNGFKIDQNIHISGINGSGKSTLLQVISSTLRGNESILINNNSLDLFKLNSYREKVFFSNPQTYLPSGTILDIITFKNIDFSKQLFENIEKYELIDLLTDLKINFSTFINNDGKNLSSGQRQIVQILRLFTNKFDVIILDEALENIDEIKYLILKKAILDFQKDSLFIEVSHSKRYITEGKEVNIEKITKNPY